MIEDWGGGGGKWGGGGHEKSHLKDFTVMHIAFKNSYKASPKQNTLNDTTQVTTHSAQIRYFLVIILSFLTRNCIYFYG